MAYLSGLFFFYILHLIKLQVVNAKTVKHMYIYLCICRMFLNIRELSHALNIFKVFFWWLRNIFCICLLQSYPSEASSKTFLLTSLADLEGKISKHYIGDARLFFDGFYMLFFQYYMLNICATEFIC